MREREREREKEIRNYVEAKVVPFTAFFFHVLQRTHDGALSLSSLSPTLSPSLLRRGGDAVGQKGPPGRQTLRDLAYLLPSQVVARHN